MQRHAPGVDGSDTSGRGDDHPLGAFFLDLVQECGLACAGFACEKNILACIAYVFECQVELGIGNEAHVLKFATPTVSLCCARRCSDQARTLASRSASLF